MNTLFEKRNGKHEIMGDYKSPCVALPLVTTDNIGI